MNVWAWYARPRAASSTGWEDERNVFPRLLTLACFDFFPKDSPAKQRLLAVQERFGTQKDSKGQCSCVVIDVFWCTLLLFLFISLVVVDCSDDWWQRKTQSILNLLDFELQLISAFFSPRFHFNSQKRNTRLYQFKLLLLFFFLKTPFANK